MDDETMEETLAREIKRDLREANEAMFDAIHSSDPQSRRSFLYEARGSVGAAYGKLGILMETTPL